MHTHLLCRSKIVFLSREILDDFLLNVRALIKIQSISVDFKTVAKSNEKNDLEVIFH